MNSFTTFGAWADTQRRKGKKQERKEGERKSEDQFVIKVFMPSKIIIQSNEVESCRKTHQSLKTVAS